MSRRALGVLLALVVLLAGCVGTETPPEDVPEAAPAGDDGSPAAPTSAAPAPGAGTDDRPHLHDYWSGRERVTLFEGTLTPGDSATVDATFYTLWVNREASVGGMLWNLPPKAIVYEGAGELLVTATWTDPRTTSLSVSYRSAAGPDYSPALALATGKPLTVPVTPDMTDMPHTTTSRWQFYFAPASQPGATLGPFDLKVEIVKLRDVTLFPAHPDLFEGKSEKVLLDADGRSQQVSYAKRVPNLILEGAFGEHETPLAELVPMETRRMRVEVALHEASANIGSVEEIRLFYRSPGREGLHPAELVSGSVDEAILIWEIPVEMEMTDTPYGDASQWTVLVEAATSFTGADPTCGGCVDTDIRYHVRVTAYDRETPGAA